MKLAVASPIVTFHPATHGDWERDGTIEDLAAVAEVADRLGYHHLTCSEHIGIPAAELPQVGVQQGPRQTQAELAGARRRHQEGSAADSVPVWSTTSCPAPARVTAR